MFMVIFWGILLTVNALSMVLNILVDQLWFGAFSGLMVMFCVINLLEHASRVDDGN